MRTLLDPRLWLLATFLIGIACDVLHFVATGRPSMGGFDAFLTTAGYGIACWIWADSNARKLYFPADLPMLYSLVAIPAYLYEAKGFKGIIYLVLAILGFVLFANFYVSTYYELEFNALYR